METYEVIHHDWYFYDGPWEWTKGSNSSDEMKLANQQQAAQNALAQGQLALQQGQLNAVNATLDPMIANGGLAPGVENAMTSLVMNNIPAQFRGLQGNINNSLVARGITGGAGGAGSGDIARGFGELGAMQAAMQQQGLSNIQVQKQGALMGDLGLKMGIGSQYGQNVGTFNAGASNALNSGVTAANNADQASTGLWGSLIGGLAGLGGSAMTAFAPKPPCWVARAVYGEDDARAEFIQIRLWQRAKNELLFRVLIALYALIGQPVGAIVKRSARLKAGFKHLFDGFLRWELR